MNALAHRRPPRAISSGPTSEVARAFVGQDAPPVAPSLVNIPNAITLSGYGATIGWLSGAPAPFAIYGLLADEADGRVARAIGQTSDFGGLFDWAVDLTLTGLVLARLGWTWALLVITPVQVYLRDKGYRPEVGSARALLTVVALLKGA